MFRRWLLLLLIVIPGLAFTTPIVQRFDPQPRIDIPDNLEGFAHADLKRFEGELGERLLRLPDDPHLLHKLGTVLFHQGRKDEAERVWRRAANMEANLAPADMMAAVQNVFSLLAKGESQIAMKRLETIETRYADSPHFNLVRAEQAVRSGNFEAAEKSYRRAVQLGPQLYVTHLNLARFHERRGDQDRARVEYKRATELAPDRAEVWNFLGAHQYRQGLYEAAHASFAKSKKADPLQPLAEIQMAQMSVEIRDLVGARSWYRAALERKPDKPNPIRVVLSDVLLRLNLLEEARFEIETVLKDEELLPLLVALGYIEESQGDMESAEKQYRRALKLQPTNVIASNNLAMLLVKMDKLPKEAVKMAAEARSQQPDNGQILGTFGCALLHANREDEASKALSQAVRVNPSDPWARYCYGKSFYSARKYAEGRLQLEGALILDPDFPRAAEIGKLLEDVRD